ncbi:MAG: site-2 protease family protein, partial [Candidatus Riflebacteria bacterium]|nr:site-2 protease family protein [Candidatus Riflebacteria bacterium]
MASPDPEATDYVDPGERGFNAKSSPVKYAVLLGGPVANIVFTVGVLTLLYWAIGEGQSTIEVAKVSQNSPAARAGIQPGDVFLSIDGIQLTHDRKGILYIRKHPGTEISIRVRRGKEQRDIKVTPVDHNGDGLIGITCNSFKLAAVTVPLPLGEAFSQAQEETWGYVTYAYISALNMFKGMFARREIPGEVGGPVSILSAVGGAVKKGPNVADFLGMLAILSMAIGVFNLLPIPALDGGRILVLAVRNVLDLCYTAVVWRRPEDSMLSSVAEEYIHTVGVFCLLGLLVVVTYKDIKDIVSPPKLTMPSFSAPPSTSPSPGR